MSKINLLQNLFIQKEIFYDAVESQDINIHEIFKADYNYGPEKEQILKQNIIINFFHTLIARLVKRFLFPASSKNSDTERYLRTKHQLEAIGGKSIILKTPDGDTLDAMYLKASDFKNSIENHFYLSKNKKTAHNSQDVFFTLKSDSGQIEPSDEQKQFIEHLKGIKFTTIKDSKEDEKFLGKIVNYVQSFFSTKFNKIILPINSLPIPTRSVPSIDDTKSSTPTVIFSGASGVLSGGYKDRAAFFLSRGIDVLMFDFRGHGASTGVPTSNKTKLDFETAYQYLSKKKGIKNKDIIAYGHCQGAGASLDLAARREGVNAIADRTFSKFRNLLDKEVPENIYAYLHDATMAVLDVLDPIVGKKLDKVAINILSYLKEKKIPEKLAQTVIPILSWVVDYDNLTNLTKVQGNIGLIVSLDDNRIPPEEYKKQTEICNERTTKIFTDINHDWSWVDNGDYHPTWTKEYKKISSEINKFLIDSNLYREVFYN